PGERASFRRPPRHPRRGRPMSPADSPRWNEIGLSEAPAIALLERFGFTHIPGDALDTERSSTTDVILTARLERALRRLNPWINDANVQRAIREVTHVSASSLLEANQKLYTTLVHGISVPQDLGEGTKGRQVRYLDFDDPRANELVV